MAKHHHLAQALIAEETHGKRGQIALADPITHLRLKFNDAKLPDMASWEEAASKIEALIPEYYDGEDLEEKQAAFSREILRARHAIATGSSRGATMEDGKRDDMGANTYTPERKLLWYLTLEHLEQQKPQEDGPEPVRTNVLQYELAQSKGMQYKLAELASFMRPIMAAIGEKPQDVVARWGESGSHFYNASPKYNPDMERSLLNFELKKSLLVGDPVEQIMMHELGHHLYDVEYPETLEKFADEMMAFQDKAQKGTLSDAEKERYPEVMIRFQLAQGAWNAAADNAVDQGSIKLSLPSEEDTHKPYPHQLLSAFLTNAVSMRGLGEYISGEESIEAGQPATANKRFSNLQNALLVGTFITHGLAENSDAGLASLCVDKQLLHNYAHPEWTPEQCWQDIHAKAAQIAELTPHPDLIRFGKEWTKERDAMQGQRNEIHEVIFAEYTLPLVEEVIQEYKIRQELMDKLKEMGFDMMPPNGQPGSNAPSQPGNGIPNPETGESADKSIADLDKEHQNGAHSQDSEAKPDPSKSKPKVDGLDNISKSNPSGAKGSGKAFDALADVPLGDGRTLEELREDPIFQIVIEEIKDQVGVLLDSFSIPVVEMETSGSRILPKGSPEERLDLAAAERDLAGSRPAIRMFRDDQTNRIPAVGDVIFALDMSGSMGWGEGSDAEKVIKSSAIMTLAIMELSEEREQTHPDSPPIGVDILLWGNQNPTFLSHSEKDNNDTLEERRERVIARADKVLQQVLSNESIHGLHGGTELQGTFTALLEDYAKRRPELDDFSPESRRGPIIMAIGSDGGVFDAAEIPLESILQTMPSLVVDSWLTECEGTILQTVLEGVGRNGMIEAYQESVNVDMHSQPPLKGLMDWLGQRMESFRADIPLSSHRDTFTNNDITEQAEEALVAMQRSGAFVKRELTRREHDQNNPNKNVRDV